MFPEDLPLLDLFLQLRQAGLPLGLEEYRVLLQALQAGLGLTDRAALQRLCQMLWVKSEDEARLFNFYFEQAELPVSLWETPVMPLDSPAPAWAETPTRLDVPLNTAAPAVDLSTSAPLKEPAEVVSPVEVATPPQETQPEPEIPEAILTSGTAYDIPYPLLVLAAEYYPVTRRQMKQSWRHLRQMARVGPSTELDVAETIRQIMRQGGLLAPVLLPARLNRSRLLLLLDRQGSMVPFHDLGEKLAETAQRGGRLRHSAVFYFNNAPVENLYADPALNEGQPLLTVLATQRHLDTSVLIFSDGGAARGRFTPARLEITQTFLKRLKQNFRHVTWLNPMPQARWVGTSASTIAQWVRMFDCTRTGLDYAVDVLRGRFA